LIPGVLCVLRALRGESNRHRAVLRTQPGGDRPCAGAAPI